MDWLLLFPAIVLGVAILVVVGFYIAEYFYHKDDIDEE
jgi:hypothetical protein